MKNCPCTGDDRRETTPQDRESSTLVGTFLPADFHVVRVWEGCCVLCEGEGAKGCE